MNVDDLILVSVDDHVVEPPDMFEGHIPAKYKDQGPKVITRPDGTDAWVFEGQEATNVGLNAVAGRPPDEYGVEPTRFSEIRSGCFDIHKRIRDMNEHRAWTHQNFGDRLPSEVFLERIVTCFIDDAFGVASRDKMNIDMITWECDYPHSDSTWPEGPESIAAYLDGVPDEDVAKITHRNALRIFSFDAFKHVPQEKATVGALRAQAIDVDLGYKSSARLKKEGTDTVSVMDLVASIPKTE